MSEARQPFLVRCEPCGYVWAAALVPMEMALFAKVLGAAHCPSCGNDAKGLFTANKEAARAWAVRHGVDVALVLGSEAT